MQEIFLFRIVFICFLDQALGMLYPDNIFKVMDSDREIKLIQTVLENTGVEYELVSLTIHPPAIKLKIKAFLICLV